MAMNRPKKDGSKQVKPKEGWSVSIAYSIWQDKNMRYLA
jgi:hypothetical protein